MPLRERAAAAPFAAPRTAHGHRRVRAAGSAAVAVPWREDPRSCDELGGESLFVVHQIPPNTRGEGTHRHEGVRRVPIGGGRLAASTGTTLTRTSDTEPSP